MRKYELVCIIQPDLDEAAFNGLVERVKGWVGDSGGEVGKVDVWGRRRLAFPIRKQREGQYVLLTSRQPRATAIWNATSASMKTSSVTCYLRCIDVERLAQD